jgi:hypothetical protein
MIINKKNSSQPFYVSFISEKDGFYNFVVNIGEINNLILQNYRFGLKTISLLDVSLGGEIPVDGYPFTAQGDDDVLKKFGEDWTETFFTVESCSVYLTIPKIPPGYNFNSPDSGYYNSKIPFWFHTENDFINAFHIDVSTSEDFYERFEKNKKYIENFDTYQFDESVYGSLRNYRPREYTDKEEYYGKIYIKIADIKIENGIVKITQFLKSNITSPSRYIRMGCTNFNSVKFFVSYTAKTSQQIFNPSSEPEPDPDSETASEQDNDQESDSEPVFNTIWKRDIPIYCPEIFLLNISEMKRVAFSVFSKFLSSFYSQYDEGLSYNFPEFTLFDPEETEYKITNLEIYRILILYKNKSGSKFIFEKIYETRPAVDEKELTEEQKRLLEPLSEKEALQILLLPEEQDFIELINFEKSETI